MVNGSIARACAPSAGLALWLAVACGGKSVSVTGSDPDGGGTSGSGGRPSQQMLDARCETVCTKAERCAGVDFDECRSGCSDFVGLALKATSCSRTAYDYLACLDALPNICAGLDDPSSACEDRARDAIDCVADYCQAHPNDDAMCRSVGAG